MTDIEFTWGAHGMSLRINDDEVKTDKAVDIIKDIALWVRKEEDDAVKTRTDKIAEDMKDIKDNPSCLQSCGEKTSDASNTMFS